MVAARQFEVNECKPSLQRRKGSWNSRLKLKINGESV